MCPCDTNGKETGISGLFLYFHLVLKKLIISVSRLFHAAALSVFR